MKKMMKFIVCLVCVAYLSMSCEKEEVVAVYPDDVVKAIVAFGPGGANDLLVRLASQKAAEHLGVEIVVENYEGAGQLTGQMEAWSREADGYTLLAINPTLIQNPITKGAPFTYEDWTPIALFNLEPEIIAVRADSPWNSVEDIIEASKTEDVVVAVPGAYTNPHICGLYIDQQTGSQFKYTYGTSGAEEVMQLLGGHVDAIINTIGACSSQVKDGSVKVLGVMSKEVPPTVAAISPGTKTFIEQGYDVEYEAWRGVAVKNGTPQEAIDKLTDAYKLACEDPELMQSFKDASYDLTFKSGQELSDFIAEQGIYMTNLLKENGF